MDKHDTPTHSALFLSAFFDELIRCGVCDVVVSPGSRSTPLSMIAYASDLNLHVDIDERGAAFFALGLAKASGRPVCVICTSGTAVANYYPAVVEAESSRVPLIVLTGDRPPRLQNLGAPQTCDQLDMFGRHVRHFQQMPLPGSTPDEIAFARQMALVAFSKAVGSQASENDEGEMWYGCISDAGPVHFNFPFEEPLKPNLEAEGLFSLGRRTTILAKDEIAASQDLNLAAMAVLPNENSVSQELNQSTSALSSGEGSALSPLVSATAYPDAKTIASIASLLKTKRTLVLCGEGSVANKAEAGMLLRWARTHQLPLLADPLSNLRSIDDPLIIDNYDNFFAEEDCSAIDVVIRFGRYPVSKACFTALAAHRPLQIVVDAVETRDFNVSTDLFIRCTPAAFVASCMVDVMQSNEEQLQECITEKQSEEQSDSFSVEVCDQEIVDLVQVGMPGQKSSNVSEGQRRFAQNWVDHNDIAATHIGHIADSTQTFEGPFVHRLFDLAPENSCIFSASSLAIRMIDTFYLKRNKQLTVFCNRGLNGIDGCISSSLGAAQNFEQTTCITGDLALIHDVNALALQQEFLKHSTKGNIPSVVIVVMNNHGGGIFEILPQKSDEAYFERLFLTPQHVNFADIARGFDIPYANATTVDEFAEHYERFLGNPGIHLIEVPLGTDRV